MTPSGCASRIVLPRTRGRNTASKTNKVAPAMTPAVLAIIAVTILASSFISGVFGMAGGMILLGVLLNYFDVASGMILFSIVQFFANGWRAFQWRHYVRWPIFFSYVGGAAIAFAAMYAVRFVPNKTMVYLALGLMPFAIEILPRAARPNIEWRGVPFVTGILTTIIQVLAGVGGLFLDIFFQKSMLDRKTTNATKATVQSLSHVVRAAYFGSLRPRPYSQVGAGAVDRARHRGDLACALRDRAHDRPRLPPMDPRHHLRRQHRLSDPRRHFVLERLSSLRLRLNRHPEARAKRASKDAGRGGDAAGAVALRGAAAPRASG